MYRDFREHKHIKKKPNTSTDLLNKDFSHSKRIVRRWGKNPEEKKYLPPTKIWPGKSRAENDKHSSQSHYSWGQCQKSQTNPEKQPRQEDLNIFNFSIIGFFLDRLELLCAWDRLEVKYAWDPSKLTDTWDTLEFKLIINVLTISKCVCPILALYINIQ